MTSTKPKRVGPLGRKILLLLLEHPHNTLFADTGVFAYLSTPSGQCLHTFSSKRYLPVAKRLIKSGYLVGVGPPDLWEACDLADLPEDIRLAVVQSRLSNT